MIEKVFELYKGKEKSIKRIIVDENINYNHMVLNNGEALPEHFSNSTVYMTIVRGIVTIGLNDEELKKHESGTVLKIPFNTKMNVFNEDKDILELIVIKAPPPKEW